MKGIIDGVLSIDKPTGISSQMAVTRVKRALGARKAGHAGTLDPDADGVLVICLGRATRLFEALQTHDKEYVGTLVLGIETNTYDAAGVVTERAEVPSLSAEAIEAVLGRFRGEIMQVPPMFSALKHRGTPLYKLARKGVVVERPPRPVTIHELELLALELPQLRLRVVCSKGTYIRALAHDIGQELGCGAHLRALTRTRSGPFRLDESIPLEEVEAHPEQAAERIVPLETMRRDLRETPAAGELAPAVRKGT